MCSGGWPKGWQLCTQMKTNRFNIPSTGINRNVLPLTLCPEDLYWPTATISLHLWCIEYHGIVCESRTGAYRQASCWELLLLSNNHNGNDMTPQWQIPLVWLGPICSPPCTWPGTHEKWNLGATEISRLAPRDPWVATVWKMLSYRQDAVKVCS